MSPQAKSRVPFRKALLQVGSLGLLAGLTLSPLVAQGQGTGPAAILSPKLFGQPAGEDVVAGRYLASELEAKLLADQELAGSQPVLELVNGNWTLKGQFNKQSSRLRAREIVAEVTGVEPADRSKVVIYPVPAPKPLSAAATKVMAQRTLREKFPNLIGSIRCESPAEGVIRLEGSTLSLEDKLEVLRAMHRAKGVKAVENAVSISPMLRNGKKVYLISSQGDLALEKLPDFQPVSEGGPVMPAVEKTKPLINEVPPLPPEIPPPPQTFNRPVPAPQRLVSETPELAPTNPTGTTRTMEPPLAPAAISTQNFAVENRNSGLAGDAVRVKTVPAGQVTHPGSSWKGPSSVLVGGQPLASTREMAEKSSAAWATAHKPARTLQAELAWREKVQGTQLANAATTQPTRPALPNEVRANPVPTSPKSTPISVAVNPLDIAKMETRDPRQALGTPFPSPLMTVVNPVASTPNKSGPVRAVSLIIDEMEEPNPSSSVKTSRGRLVLDEEVPTPSPGTRSQKFSKAHLESAVRIACAGLAQKVEILEQGSITLVRVTTATVAAERKALEALVLLPEIHDTGVKLEVRTAN